MAQSVEHIVHIDGVVGSSPTVTTQNRITLAVILFLRYARLVSNQRCHDVNTFTSWGAEPKRRQWRMKRGGSVVSKGVRLPLQGGITTIANLTEQAKRSETVGSSRAD